MGERRSQEIKKRPDGAFEVVVSYEIRDPAHLVQLRDRAKSELDRTRLQLAKLEQEFADLDAACALFDQGKA